MFSSNSNANNMRELLELFNSYFYGNGVSEDVEKSIGYLEKAYQLSAQNPSFNALLEPQIELLRKRGEVCQEAKYLYAIGYSHIFDNPNSEEKAITNYFEKAAQKKLLACLSCCRSLLFKNKQAG